MRTTRVFYVLLLGCGKGAVMELYMAIAFISFSIGVLVGEAVGKSEMRDRMNE